jgi:hypothetical protein
MASLDRCFQSKLNLVNLTTIQFSIEDIVYIKTLPDRLPHRTA